MPAPWVGAALLLLGLADAGAAQTSPAPRPYTVVDDAIPTSLTGEACDPSRGRAIVANRQQGLCLLCHSGPFPEIRLQGSIAPDLAGAGSRWSKGQERWPGARPRSGPGATSSSGEPA